MNNDTGSDAAYCNALFLVHVFPDDAVGLLSKCDREKLAGLADDACTKLGGNFWQMKALVMERRTDELRRAKSDISRRTSTRSSPITPTRRALPAPSQRGQTPPSTPGSKASSRPPGLEKIAVHHGGEEFVMMAGSSGNEWYFIGEDKLSRFHNMIKNWANPPAHVRLGRGGKLMTVSEFVGITWSSPEDYGTKYHHFWVVPAGHITRADVLLGDGGVTGPYLLFLLSRCYVLESMSCH